MTRSQSRNLDYRRARTRTLIQLGGLVEKSGLLDKFGIQVGDDLQKDPEVFDDAATLLGAFLENKDALELPEADAQKMLWCKNGKVKLASW